MSGACYLGARIAMPLRSSMSVASIRCAAGQAHLSLASPSLPPRAVPSRSPSLLTTLRTVVCVAREQVYNEGFARAVDASRSEWQLDLHQARDLVRARRVQASSAQNRTGLEPSTPPNTPPERGVWARSNTSRIPLCGSLAARRHRAVEAWSAAGEQWPSLPRAGQARGRHARTTQAQLRADVKGAH